MGNPFFTRAIVSGKIPLLLMRLLGWAAAVGTSQQKKKIQTSDTDDGRVRPLESVSISIKLLTHFILTMHGF